MTHSSEQRTQFYQVLTRKITTLILTVSFIPMVLTTGILFYRFNHSYTEKVKAHVMELVQNHGRNIDTFLSEKVGNIRYLERLFSERFTGVDPTDEEQVRQIKVFLKTSLDDLNEKYGDVFTDLGLVAGNGIQFAYEGPFLLENADYAQADWFRAAQGKPVYISDVFAGLRGYPHFIITVPVETPMNEDEITDPFSPSPFMERGVGGEVTGQVISDRFHKETVMKEMAPSNPGNLLLRATINFAAFNEMVEKIHIGRTGFAFIINGKGEPQTRMDQPPDASLVASIVSRTRGEGETDLDLSRDDFLCIASPLRTVDWMMVFRQQRSDAYKDLINTQILAFLLIFVGAAAIISVAVFLPKNIVKLIAGADEKSEEMNRQVIESGKLATIGELAAGIAHEINNPVAIMVEEAGWMDDLLEEEDLQATKNFDEFKRALKQIDTQGRRCKEITHKLLSFARKTDSTINDVQINDVIREIVSLTEQMAKYNSVSIETALHEGIPYIRISPAEFQQVLLNLINNAIDAMEKGGGQIRIESKISTIEKDHVVVVVEDDGPGIPRENLERVFDPFFTTKPVGKGTGLGLSICYGIIRKMGGKIDVRSEVGVGTRFRIWIPFQDHLERGTVDAMGMKDNEHRERTL